MTQAFWRPKPREPWSDWRMYGMLVPILVSACGFFVTGIFAFAFSDIAVIPRPTQSWMVIVGSALIIFGAELNTPFTSIEVFRKILRKEANTWDTSALIISLVGTVVNLLVTFASRLSLDPLWKDFVLNWGPLLSGFAVACDYYGALVELGFLFGSYELRLETWLAQEVDWNQEHGVVEMVVLPKKQELVFNPAWPEATIHDVRGLVAGLNGERGAMTARSLLEMLHANERRPKSDGTVKRWVRETRKGTL